MNASKQTYQCERDQAITTLYKRNLSARQVAYNLNVSHEEVLEVIELLNLKEIKGNGSHERAEHRHRVEEHQEKLRSQLDALDY